MSMQVENVTFMTTANFSGGMPQQLYLSLCLMIQVEATTTISIIER